MATVAPSTPSFTGHDTADAFRASMARHGGRSITNALYRRLTAGVEDTTERGAARNRESISGEAGAQALHRFWHYSIDPAPGDRPKPCTAISGAEPRYYIGGRESWTPVAEGFAKAGGNPHESRYLTERRNVVPVEALDWPIVRAAHCAPLDRALEALVRIAVVASYPKRVRELVRFGLADTADAFLAARHGGKAG